MKTLKYELNKASKAFGIESDRTGSQTFFLSFIAIPMAIFWRIIDFLVIDLPDTALGASGHKRLNLPPVPPPPAAEIEKMRQDRLRQEATQRKANIEARKRRMWPEDY